MAIDFQDLVYRATITAPKSLDPYYAQRNVISIIETFLVFRSGHTRLDGGPCPVFDMLIEGNPNGRKIYLQEDFYDFVRPYEIPSPFATGIRYPQDYGGGFCYDDETSVLSISEIGEGTEQEPQYWAFDYDEVIFDDDEPFTTRWHISGCSVVNDEVCTITLQFTFYSIDLYGPGEPPTNDYYRLIDLLLIPIDSCYCNNDNTPIFSFPISLDSTTPDWIDESSEGIAYSSFNFPASVDEEIVYYWDIPYVRRQYTINELMGEGRRYDLVRNLPETRWLLFEEMMRDKDRTVPVVLVCSKRDGEFDTAPWGLCHNLVGMANVFCADLSDEYVNARLNKLFRRQGPEYEFKCRPGHVRVYPGNIDLQNRDDAKRCPSFNDREIDMSTASDSIAGFIGYSSVHDLILSYQRFTFETPHDVAGLARKRALDTADTYIGARSILSSIDEQAAHELDGLVQEEAGRQLEECQLEIALLTDELEKLVTLYNGAQKKLEEKAAPDKRIDKYYDLKEARDRHRSLIRKLAGNQKLLEELKKGLPHTVADILRAVSEAYQEHVVVLDEAYASAEKYGRQNLDDAWAILCHVPTTLWELHFEGGHNIEQEFQDATGYELALTETGPTKGNKRFMKKRELKYGDGKIDITPHIKGGTREQPLRIHYGLDNDDKKIVIGHCGEHLPTSRGRK